MVRTTWGMLINEVFRVKINGVPFRIIIVEETLGLSSRLVKKSDSSVSESDSEYSLDNSSWEYFFK